MKNHMMTPEKKLAISERDEYDSLSPEARSLYRNLGNYFRKTNPSIGNGAKNRSILLLAGPAADPLWERITLGMPTGTAVGLLAEARRSADGETFEERVRARLNRYDREGTIRIVGNKIFRTRASNRDKISNIVHGRVSAESRKRGSPKTFKRIVREAVAAWIASRLPSGAEERGRAEILLGELMHEIEVVLSSFDTRIRRAKPHRDELFAACDLLNVPRPKWNRPADQERAWRNRRAALRATHPDALGHAGGVSAFQSIKDAYDVIVRYNDSLHRVTKKTANPNGVGGAAESSTVGESDATRASGSEEKEKGSE